MSEGVEGAHAVAVLAPARVAHLYPAAAVVGGASAAAALVRFGPTGRGFVAAFVVSVCVVLAVIDVERSVLPNRIVVPSFAAVLAAQIALFPDRATEWIVASLATALLLLLPRVFRRGAIGMGDVKLGLLVGAALGETALRAIILGVVAAWPVAAYLVLRDGRSAARGSLPLGPFLAFGAIAAVLVS
jgi:leader peptidase (prepilin peptidase) / N-methyltransferase